MNGKEEKRQMKNKKEQRNSNQKNKKCYKSKYNRKQVIKYLKNGLKKV